MQRYKIKIEYDGTPFVGWQFQKNGLSIQEILQKAISNFLRICHALFFWSARGDSLLIIIY